MDPRASPPDDGRNRNDSAPPGASRRYRGDGFTMELPDEGWNDNTIHQLRGPTVAGRSHSVSVQTYANVEAETARAFAAPLVDATVLTLRRARRVTFEEVRLHTAPAAQQSGDVPQRDPSQQRRGRRACHAVLMHFPEGTDRPDVLEQLFVLSPEEERRGAKTGYVLTATFSKKSHRLVGAEVRHLMRSFRPL